MPSTTGSTTCCKQALAELGRTRAPHGEEALAAIEAQLRATFGVRAGITSEELVAELSETFAEEMLPMLASALRAGSKQRPRAGANACNRPSPPARASRRVEALERLLPHPGKEPRERLATKKGGGRRAP